MDLLFQHGRLTAAEVRDKLPGDPSYSTVRALLRVLEEKGHVRHEEEALRYVYTPTVAREEAKRSAVRHLLETFFDGSPESAVAALLDESAGQLSEAEFDRLEALIERARRDGR